MERPRGLCPEVICALAGLHPHPSPMLPPATKQETSAGLRIHCVNKRTGDVGASAGTGGLRLSPARGVPAFPRGETGAAARRLGPRESLCPPTLTPSSSPHVPEPGGEFLLLRATAGGKLTSAAPGTGSQNRTQRCEPTGPSAFHAGITTRVPRCAHAESHVQGPRTVETTPSVTWVKARHPSGGEMVLPVGPAW